MTFKPQPVPADYTDRLAASLRAQRAVGEATENKDRMSFRRKVAAAGLVALTGLGVAKLAYDQPSEVERKPEVEYIMKPGDRAITVARDHNPGENILNESDYIQSQDPNGDGVFEGGERVMVPYTELPDAHKESQPVDTAGDGPRG